MKKIRSSDHKVLRQAATAVGILAGASAGAAAGWIWYSRRFVDHGVPLRPAIQAPRATFATANAGELSYYADRGGAGRPVVLIHSVNAAASAYEVRPLFEMFRGVRPVFALDLPGFGFSERRDRVYTREIYSTAILDFIDREVDAAEGVDVIAMSLSCEFTARAALERPELFHSLAFLSPTGFGKPNNTGSAIERQKEGRSGKVHRALSHPLWTQPFFDLLTTPASIRYYLGKSFEGAIDPGLAEYNYATSHQPGARFAPLYFVSGKLFTPDVLSTVYSRLPQPVAVLCDRDGYVTFEELPGFLAQHPNWRAERIEGTRGLPHFEKLDETTAALESFWSELPEPVESDEETRRRTQPHPA